MNSHSTVLRCTPLGFQEFTGYTITSGYFLYLDRNFCTAKLPPSQIAHLTFMPYLLLLTKLTQCHNGSIRNTSAVTLKINSQPQSRQIYKQLRVWSFQCITYLVGFWKHNLFVFILAFSFFFFSPYHLLSPTHLLKCKSDLFYVLSYLYNSFFNLQPSGKYLQIFCGLINWLWAAASLCTVLVYLQQNTTTEERMPVCFFSFAYIIFTIIWCIRSGGVL